MTYSLVTVACVERCALDVNNNLNTNCGRESFCDVFILTTLLISRVTVLHVSDSVWCPYKQRDIKALEKKNPKKSHQTGNKL